MLEKYCDHCLQFFIFFYVILKCLGSKIAYNKLSGKQFENNSMIDFVSWGKALDNWAFGPVGTDPPNCGVYNKT